MLCGLMLPSGGEIDVLGCKIPRDAETLKRHIGYMTQRFTLYEDLTVLENLSFLAAVHEVPRSAARARIEELLKRYWLTEQRTQLAGTMSGGQKQRLALAAPCCTSRILSSTSRRARSIRNLAASSGFPVRARGRKATLLVSTHYMDEAERCTRLAILDAGRIVADGTPRGFSSGCQAAPCWSDATSACSTR
jgi:ABC-2 type transport system ATP-binding protein